MSAEDLERRLGELVPAGSVERWEGADGRARPLVAPEEERQFADVLRLAGREGLRVLPLGLGSKLGWIRPPAGVDLVLSTRRYRGVTSYEPADGTVTALAGTPMADLAAVVGEGGHHLSPAVPLPAGSTLGGVVAAGQSGDDRLRYGALRENLLGTRFVLADGTLAKSGGQLVKNVTGYDVHRALCGSYGSLGVVLEASLRLHPLPEERGLFLARVANRGEALDLARAIRRAPVRPVTLLAHDLDDSTPNTPWTVYAVLGGRGPVLDAEAAALRALAPSASLARGNDVGPITHRVRDLELSEGRWPALTLETRPSRFEAVLVDTVQLTGAEGYEVRFLLHPALARAVVYLLRGPADAPDADVLGPERVAALDARLAKLPAVVRWRDLAPATAARVQPLGRPGAGLPTMRALRAALDPAGTLAPRLFDAEA